MKVCTVYGTRPELIKLSRIIPALDNCVDHILVNTNQNFSYELNKVFLDTMSIRKPDYELNVVGDNLGQTCGNVIARSYELFEYLRPDAVLCYGDTNSCLSLYSAKRLKIPCYHMEAGNRCNDANTPEETNRKILDHISDINMTVSEYARQFLISEGLSAQTVINTGSCMYEILNWYRGAIAASTIIHDLELESKDYFVFSTHREEHIDNVVNLREIIEILIKISYEYNIKIIWPVHPRTRKALEQFGIVDALSSKIKEFQALVEKGNIILHAPLNWFDYVALQQQALCVVSDSGTLAEESNILGFPAVMLRTSHERMENEGNLIWSGLNSLAVIRAMSVTVSRLKPFPIIPDYCVENVSNRVVNIILSYTQWINKNVWRKYE